MNQTLLRYASTGALAVLSLSGLVAAHGVDISDTGPDSSNRVTLSERNSARLSNRNRVDVDNRNWQWARTGDATVSRNTSGGDATTGDATNDNFTDTFVSIEGWSFDLDFGGGGGFDASISNTGPDSTNRITANSNNRLDINNNNNVDVSNSNRQSASTGDATVSRNTSGGDATTGNAENTNDTATEVSISNGGFSGSGGGGGGASASIDTTGPDSTNTINLSSRNTLNVDNSNRVDVDNSNHQSASTGDATVSRNTSGGDATTGDASNSNSASTTVEIN